MPAPQLGSKPAIVSRIGGVLLECGSVVIAHDFVLRAHTLGHFLNASLTFTFCDCTALRQMLDST